MEEMGGEDIIESIKFFNEIDSIFKIIPPERVAEEKIIDILLKVRQMAREKKMYDISDYIREKLRENNINIEDIQEGQIWYKK